MALDKISINTKYSPSTNIKISAIMAAMGRAKMYELLHKQIWRKDKNRLLLWQDPFYPHHNGRPVAYVQRWNIKSQYTEPYSYSVKEGDDPARTFGLNQLFMGQDPFAPYQGNPGDGIYHDDCYITPKMMPMSAEHYYYVYTYNDSGEYGVTTTKYFRERDDNGTVVIDSVELKNYVATVDGKPQDRYGLAVNYTSGAVDMFDLGYGSYNAIIDRVEKKKSHEVLGLVEEYKITYDFGSHGAVLWEQVIDMPYQFTTTSSQKTTKEDGWIRMYSDGTVIQYRPLEVEYWGDGMDNTIPGHYKMLPMVYTDTGDLTMPVADFVNNWGDYFELVVHEDSEWWESLVAPVMAIIIIVLSVVTAGAAAVVAAGMSEAVLIGGIISAIGVLSGNKTLSLVGSVISLGATAYTSMASTAAAQKIGVEAAKTASAETMATTIGGLSASEVFSALPNIGLGNLVAIGAKIVSIGMSIDSIMNGEPDVEQVAAATEPVGSSEISFTTTLGKDDSEYDVFGQMGKQFEMY